MVATADLDRITTHAAAAGREGRPGRVTTTSSVPSAPAARSRCSPSTPHAQTLTGLWRFRHRWEADATRGLRAGKPAAIDAYAEHGRLHDGPAEVMLDAAYTAWAADLAAGRSTLLLAADRATVTALNTRAHDDRVAAGLVHADGDRARRRGDRRARRPRRHPPQRPPPAPPATAGTSATAPSGRSPTSTPTARSTSSPSARTRPAPHRRGASVRLPADYVREHVELGYAATVHRAQGMTVDHGHVLATAGHDPPDALRRDDPRPRGEPRLRRHRRPRPDLPRPARPPRFRRGVRSWSRSSPPTAPSCPPPPPCAAVRTTRPRCAGCFPSARPWRPRPRSAIPSSAAR